MSKGPRTKVKESTVTKMETIWQNKITLDHYQEYKMSMHESTLRKINNIINIWERRYQSPIQKKP